MVNLLVLIFTSKLHNLAIMSSGRSNFHNLSFLYPCLPISSRTNVFIGTGREHIKLYHYVHELSRKKRNFPLTFQGDAVCFSYEG
jgi:hypothetical protein